MHLNVRRLRLDGDGLEGLVLGIESPLQCAGLLLDLLISSASAWRTDSALSFARATSPDCFCTRPTLRAAVPRRDTFVALTAFRLNRAPITAVPNDTAA